jgi:hypothetical protein
MPTDPKNPHRDTEASPTRSVHHDVLVINPKEELYRFNVRKTDEGRVGEYLSVDYLGEGAFGHRKVMHIARKGTPEHPRGAAFSTLPVKEEPASSYVCCYLINARNLNYRNVWTQAEWNDAPDTGDDQSPPAGARDRDIRCLLAHHGGQVLYLEIPKGRLPESSQGWKLVPIADQEVANLRTIDLRANPEVWNLLRNGCVAGSADYAGRDTPLVNVTSLAPCAETRHSRRELPSNEPITGTLDFKWPLRPPRDGDKADIVVGFLPLRNNRYRMSQQALFERFEAIARTWDFDQLLDIRFETALPFDAFDPIAYDILVSLDPLGPDVVDEQGRPVPIPQSELGNFACRVDRGIATMFAGMPQGLKGPRGEVMEASDYPRSNAFQHFVVHEFGHALGLLHLHQSPHLNQEAMDVLYKELKVARDDELAFEEKIKGIMLERLGITVPPNYVEEAISGVWPGNERYSDWPVYDDSAREAIRAYLQDSIMIGLAAHAKGKMAGTQPDQYLVAPSRSDREWLRSLYPAEQFARRNFARTSYRAVHNSYVAELRRLSDHPIDETG